MSFCWFPWYILSPLVPVTSVSTLRPKPGAPSRQAVIAKALYSVSSYKNWADKAKDAFDKGE